MKNTHKKISSTRDNLAYNYAFKMYLNFHPLEVVSRLRDHNFQVGENYAYLFDLR